METFSNSTLPPLPSYTLLPLPPLLPFLSDAHLGLLLLIVAYWGISLIFHIFDTYDLFPQYRLHTPAELLKRNHASRLSVLRDVLIQQFIQTLFGLVLALFDPVPTTGKEHFDVAVWGRRLRIATRGVPIVLGAVGIDARGLAEKIAARGWGELAGAMAGGVYPNLTREVVNEAGVAMLVPGFAAWELTVAKVIYWAVVPFIQFWVAVMILDTWQYFWHRAMHVNQWLYTTLHSRHHRLHVPYAYGALYNHPVEGFILDTLGAGIAYLLTGMTNRQSMFFFTCSTIKTVDDHCGYALPWDPLQHLTGNNAAYHDIHHQSWGIKSNFSQPFLTVWDHWLGTVWRGGDVKLRYERSRIQADRWWEEQRRRTEGEILPDGKTSLYVQPAEESEEESESQEREKEREAAISTSAKRSSRKRLSVGQAGSLGGLNCGSGGVPRMASRR